MLRSKQPPVTREFSGGGGGGAFALCFERNCDITPAAALFDRGGSVIAVGRHLSVHVRG